MEANENSLKFESEISDPNITKIAVFAIADMGEKKLRYCGKSPITRVSLVTTTTARFLSPKNPLAKPNAAREQKISPAWDAILPRKCVHCSNDITTSW